MPPSQERVDAPVDPNLRVRRAMDEKRLARVEGFPGRRGG